MDKPSHRFEWTRRMLKAGFMIFIFFIYQLTSLVKIFQDQFLTHAHGQHRIRMKLRSSVGSLVDLFGSYLRNTYRPLLILFTITNKLRLTDCWSAGQSVGVITRLCVVPAWHKFPRPKLSDWFVL